MNSLYAEVVAAKNVLQKVERFLANLEKHEPEAFQRTLERVKPGRPKVEAKPPEEPAVKITEPMFKEEEVSKAIAILPEKPDKPAKTQGGKTNTIIAAYCEAYKARYGNNPIITKKDTGQLMNFSKSCSEEMAAKLVRHYVSMQDAWFNRKEHDVYTFLQNVNKVKNSMETGKQTTAKQAVSLERDAHNERMLKKMMSEQNG